MKNLTAVLVFVVLIFCVMSCGLAGKLAEKGLDKELDTHRAGSLWDDVPRMDGLDDSPTEDLPVAIRLVMHTFVNVVLNSDKDQKKHVSTDWIFYNYKGGETDIDKFYTAGEMKITWSPSPDARTATVLPPSALKPTAGANASPSSPNRRLSQPGVMRSRGASPRTTRPPSGQSRR